MKYTDFRTIDGVVLKMLSLIGVITRKRVVVEADNYPNFDMTGYRGSDPNSYVFEHI